MGVSILIFRHYNINRLTEHTLNEILQVMTTTGVELNREVDNALIEEVCRRFNEKLIFEPSARSKWKPDKRL
jgi:hypothetical protein